MEIAAELLELAAIVALALGLVSQRRALASLEDRSAEDRRRLWLGLRACRRMLSSQSKRLDSQE